MARKTKLAKLQQESKKKKKKKRCRKKYNLLLNGHASEVYRIVSSFPLSSSSLKRHCSKSLLLLPYSYSPLFIFLHESADPTQPPCILAINFQAWDHRPPSVLCFLVPWADNDDTTAIKGWRGGPIPLSPPLSNLAENKGDTRRRRRRRRTMGEVERPRETVSNPRESRNCSSHRRLHIPAIFSPFS